ncbi:hypothetical protein CPC08DRAFT_254961 [Agrocybe pediades]|nr:hypothetical protein CPC08DRAFT_254961 [Agrocybe pediades]
MVSTKGWDDVSTILSHSKNFFPVQRVKANSPSTNLAEVIKNYEKNGLPLVIEGLHKLPSWPKDMLTLENFVENTTSKEVHVRNIRDWTDSKMLVDEFVTKCRSMAPYGMVGEKERFYGKDLDCPKPWEDWLQKGEVVPSSLLWNGPQDYFRYLTGSKSVQTLMCYLGIGDTFTPCHKDLCASSGQNLMCYTENDGSSFWFMTSSEVAPEAAEYFQTLNHELDHENHVLTLDQFSRAPFKIYILQQKLGDLVLVPPRSCHQVVNAGGITVKTSWSRMTCDGLATAYFQELPLYRRLCRRETYRVKNMVFHSLKSQAEHLQSLFAGTSTLSSSASSWSRKSVTSTMNDFDDLEGRKLADSITQLLGVYDCILAEEYHPFHKQMGHLILDAVDADEDVPITCDFCGADIFQSFFECRKCVDDASPGSEAIHMCPGCYVEGRSCECSVMKPMQYQSYLHLVQVRSDAAQAVTRYKQRHDSNFEFKKLKLKDNTVPALFWAADILMKVIKNATRIEKVCSSRIPHTLSQHWVFNCKPCHRGLCFTHILQNYRIHSAHLLILTADDKDHVAYHRHHIQGNNVYNAELSDLRERQKHGHRHPGYVQLVYNAIFFKNCLPFRQGLRAGWYDNELEAAQQEEDGYSPQDLPFIEPASTSSSCSPIPESDEETTPSITTDENLGENLKRKRLIMDYVDVPPPPYQIKNDSSFPLVHRMTLRPRLPL